MSLFKAYQNVTFLELTKLSLYRAYQNVTFLELTKMSLPHFSLPKCHIYRAYQIVTTTFVFTKLCLSFLCLPNCCYQNDASCTYLLVITKFFITLSPFYQIVSYQICHYKNCHYRISITKNQPIIKLTKTSRGAK